VRRGRAPARAAALLALIAVGLATAGVVALASPSDRDPARALPGHARRLHPTGRLVFDEEFDGSRLDRRRWSTCYWWGRRGCTIGTDGEREWYQPHQVVVSRGTARLIATRRRIRGADGRTYPFVSGMISTGPPPGRRAPKFAFRYGWVQARIRVPSGRGLWPTFWLLPADRSDLPEIDVMEMLGQTADQVHLHLHFARARQESVVGVVRRVPPAPGRWHVYGIDWAPGRLTWTLDGRRVFQVSGSAVPRVRMYLLADLAVGGQYPGPPDRATHFPATLQIDWIRVWR
jgi:beta-glucanase (GH16 family)